MLICIIRIGLLSQMCAPYIKIKSLKSYTVRLWEKLCLKQQENITDRINYEVQSSWTVTSCFWERIINGQHKASKCTGWAQSRDERMTRSTWLNKLKSNIAIQWTMCRGSVNSLTELHFPFGLDEFYPYLSFAEKIGHASHLSAEYWIDDSGGLGDYFLIYGGLSILIFSMLLRRDTLSFWGSLLNI